MWKRSLGVLVFALMFSHCSYSATSPSTPADANGVFIQNGAAYNGMVFSPETLTVVAGTTVSWQNNDTVSHSVVADGGLFNSGAIEPGGGFSFKFVAAGSYGYSDSLSHGKGSIIVTSSQPQR
jgi:plastocyanin